MALGVVWLFATAFANEQRVTSGGYEKEIDKKISKQKTSVPVMIGGDADMDACGAVGMVRGISRYGDGFLAVRSGPGSKYKIIDKFYRNGEEVIMCDSKGKWIGIVYGENCGEVYDNIAKQKPYEGTCRSGWVFEKYIRFIAG